LGEVDRVKLGECQRAGKEGHLAGAMGAFLCWIAGRYEELQQRLQMRSREIRSQGRGRAVHARLPGALAELQSGFELWLEFAWETGAIETAEQPELMRRCERALQELAALRTRYHQGSDPARRFVSLLNAALACGQGHVADRKGNTPESPEIWGWRRNPTGPGLVPQGSRIGWVIGSDLFLEPTFSYHIAQSVAGTERLTVSQQALHHRQRANQASGASRTYVVCEESKVMGYYALASGALTVESAPGRFRRNMPDPIPVAVFARLAVDRSYQGRGVGRALFRDGARRVVHAADAIGIRGIVVHAISEEARKFYQALGFDPCRNEPMMLVVTLSDVRNALL